MAQLAVALAAVLVGDVPGNDRRMIGITLGQRAVHLAHLLPVDGRGQAVVVAAAMQRLDPLLADAQHFREFLRHPGRTSPARSGQKDKDAIGMQGIEHLIQPAKLVTPLFGLQTRPAEDAHRHDVAAGLLHHLDVAGQNFRAIEPLIRVVIGAVQQHRSLVA